MRVVKENKILPVKANSKIFSYILEFYQKFNISSRLSVEIFNVKYNFDN